MLKTSYNCQVAEERSPAECHGVTNSPHVGDGRQKSISRGITTVSVSKRTQMPAKVREFRKPIFSPTGHLLSSDSIRQMIPIVHVELSSGTKRTENSVQRNQNLTTNQAQLQKRQSEPYSVGENIQDQQMHYSNILSIMRDQLNRSIMSLQKKNEQQNRRNEQLIMALQKRLKQNEGTLMERTMEVCKLKEMVNPTKRSKQQGSIQINSSVQYLSGKLRDVEFKIKYLVQESGKHDQTKVLSMTKKLEDKIDGLAAEFMKMELTKFNNLSTRVTKFVESRDKLLQTLQTSIEQIQKRQPTNNPNNLITLYDDKITDLKSNQEKILKSLEAYSMKEFKYDNFQLDTLKSQLTRLGGVVIKLQTDLSTIKPTSLPYQPSPNQKPITSIQTINPTFKQFQSEQKQYLMNSKLSFTGQTCSFEDYQPPQQSSEDERDHFFYPQQDSSYERFTDEEQELIEQESSQAVVQLADAIRKRRMKLPVKCAVNQGYVKLVDVGTYVLDLKGSLMEFTTQDLETAVGRKLIVL